MLKSHSNYKVNTLNWELSTQIKYPNELYSVKLIISRTPLSLLNTPMVGCLFLWHLIITKWRHKFILGAYQKDLIYISSLVGSGINEGRTLVWLLFIKCTRGESCARKIVSWGNNTVFPRPCSVLYRGKGYYMKLIFRLRGRVFT